MFTSTFWVDVDEEDTIQDVCLEFDSKARSSIVDALAQHGLTVDDAAGAIGWFGTSYWIIDETRVF